MNELQTGLDFVCDGGRLLGVDACYFDGDSAFVTAFRFRFALCPVAFYVVETDDTITAGYGEHLRCGDGHWVDVSTQLPWSECVGFRASWAWRLANQQGYTDGIRIELVATDSKESRVVELVVVASAFRLFVARAI